MPLDLKTSNDNLMVIFDVVSQTKVGLYYRTPTTSERIGYKSKMTKMIINKASTRDILKMKLDEGKKFLTGIRDGDLVYGEKEVSSNKDNENFREDWLDLLYEAASQIIDQFATSLLGDEATFLAKENHFLSEES